MPTPLDHPALEAIPSDAPSERRFFVSLSESEMATMLAALSVSRRTSIINGWRKEVDRAAALHSRLLSIASEA